MLRYVYIKLIFKRFIHKEPGEFFVTLGPSGAGKSTLLRVKRVAKILGITDILNKNVTKISGGQQQRVALARAIVRESSFYFLDEPLSNLDARTRFIARGELKRIQKELTGTFIYVTHDQKEAMSLADRIAVLHMGKFEQIGKPMELYEYPKTKWVAEFIGDFPMNFLPGKMMGEEGVEIWLQTGMGKGRE